MMKENKEEMMQAGAKVLKLIADSLEQGKDFALEQAPLIVQELIAWKRVELTAKFLIAIAVLLVGLFFARLLLKYSNKWYNADEPEKLMPCAFISIMGILIGAMTTAALMSSTLQVWLAPRLYVLEYFKDLF